MNRICIDSSVDMNKKMNLRFDRFSFAVTYGAVKDLIISELNRLAAETGHPIKLIPVCFSGPSVDNAVACFRYNPYNGTPIAFIFYMDTLCDLTANEIIDVCRHEFAHFITLVEHHASGHGAKWAAVCKRLGARPDTHIHRELTRHFQTA